MSSVRASHLVSKSINSLNRKSTPLNQLPTMNNSMGLRFMSLPSLGPQILANMPMLQSLQGSNLLPITSIGSLPSSQVNSSSLFNWQANQTRPQLHVIGQPLGTSVETAAMPTTTSLNGSSLGPVVVNAKNVGAPMNGQLLTLPAAVVKRLSLSKPLALKINNKQINVPPSGFFQTSEGLKVFLPPNTFPAAEDLDASNYSVKTTDSKGDWADRAFETSPKRHKTPVPAVDMLPQIESVKGAVPVDVDKSKFKHYFSICPIQKLSNGFDCLLHIFQYLNIQDLVRVGIVCKSWQRISQQPCLWKQISFADMRVASWSSMIRLLKKRSVQSISLLDLVQWPDMAKTWHGLTDLLQELPDLRQVTFGNVPAAILDLVCRQLPLLDTIRAESISNLKDETRWAVPTPLDVGQFKKLTNLKELRLKGPGGLVLPSFSLDGGLEQLGNLVNLQVLSILSFKDVPETSFMFVSRLPNLRELSIGDCTDWTNAMYQEVGRCVGLHRLHLEKGGNIPDLGLGEALIKLDRLERLELLNYKIPVTFKSHLAQLSQLKHLVIQPDNTTLVAEMNSNTLAAIGSLTTLISLQWLVSGQDCNAIILNDADNTDSNHSNQPSEQQKWIPFLTDDETQYIGLDQLKIKLSDILPSACVSVVSLKPAADT